MKYSVFFIGFGEAAYNIAKGLHGAGLTDLAAYDVMYADPAARAGLLARACEAGVQLLDAKEACYGSARFVCSLTSATVAVRVAEGIVPFLTDGQVYVDMNSAGPAVKEAIASLPRQAGVQFCDAAVMGTVPGAGHRVPMLLAGDGAQDFYDAMSKYGMRLTVLNAPAGSASAIKMLKSVVMKGYAQLIMESFVAAEKYGVLDTLADSLSESLNGKTVEQMADTFVARTMIHAQRRSGEMRDVKAMLNGLHCDASMTDATIAKLDALANDNWKEKLGADGAKLSYREAVAILAECE